MFRRIPHLTQSLCGHCGGPSTHTHTYTRTHIHTDAVLGSLGVRVVSAYSERSVFKCSRGLPLKSLWSMWFVS